MGFFVPVILGTAREGRQSEKAAEYLLKKVREFGFETELIDVKDYLFKFTGNNVSKVRRLGEKIRRCDGLVIVSPEYNHGYPGELKIMLDSLYSEYANKPVAVCGVSVGGFGGVRVVEALKLVLIALRTVPIYNSVYFSNIDKGVSDELYSEFVKKMLEELEWYIKALKKV